MEEQILTMVRARLNRVSGGQGAAEDSLDEYLRSRISAAVEEMERMGIRLNGRSGDNLLAADYVCWSYANREKAERMPEWLRIKLWERQMAEGRDDS